MRTYPDTAELYRRIELGGKAEAKRPIAEKMAVAAKLRQVQESLAPVRAANKARRALEPVKIRKVS